jgi:hypothetical protein
MADLAKLDLKKTFKALYNPPSHPVLVDVPAFNCLMIDGEGDPNTSPRYQAVVEALYSVSYTLKFAAKQGALGLDYSVMPLEGLWWTPELEASADPTAFLTGVKDQWLWTMFIVQPDTITEEMVHAAMAAAGKKKSLLALPSMRFECFAEGRCAQVMHLGPYATEGPTVAALHAFIAESGHEIRGKHHEIYLSDPRRAAAEKMRTVIRQPVA